MDRETERLEQDLAMMRDPDRWPGTVLHLKTRPRPNQRLSLGEMRFAVLPDPDEPTVYTTPTSASEQRETIDYQTLEELAEAWTVD